METEFTFTFENLEGELAAAVKQGYEILTCKDYALRKISGSTFRKTLVNRIDVDYSIEKVLPLVNVLNKLGIKGSFFIRLHAQEYNPFSLANYCILKHVRDTGHEIGYHSEVVDQAATWKEEAVECLKRDISILGTMLSVKVCGIASHGGETGLNNLDFWNNRSAKEFGLLYEAYDTSPAFNLFHESLYISDSEWTHWKCYKSGVLVPGDQRCLSQHLADKPRLIYHLTHSDTY
jgi:hypothetical protein